MNLLRRLLALPFLSMLLLCHAPSALAVPLSLGEDIAYASVVDPQGALTFEQAQQRLKSQTVEFQPALSRGYTRETYWLKFELPQNLFNQENRWLELGPNFVDDIQLFFREKNTNGAWQQRKTGDLLNAVSDLDYRSPIFVLPAPQTNAPSYEVVIRVQSSSTVILSAKLWTPEEFLGHASRSTSFWSFYFGLAALSSLLALILALTLRTYLLWTATVFSAAYLFVASIQGYIHWVFPSIGFPVQHYATSALALISFALLMWMSTETINLREHLPWAHKLLIYACRFTLALLLLIPLDLYQLAVKIKIVILLVTYTVFIYSVFHIWARDKFSLVTLGPGISPVVCMIASLLGLFSAFGWIPFNEKVYVIWQYALVVNMLLVLAISVYRIREKRLAEFEKEKLANELESEREANFNQRQFMGTVSHEFRTPLAVISAALENLHYLDNEPDSPRVLRYEKIKRANERLIQLTDNCLADARLAGDVTALDIQSVDLLQLVSSAASLVGLSDNHRLRLTINGEPLGAQVPSCCVAADPAMMRIALSNVIDNAVKYSDGGCITIDCKKSAQYVLVRICDEGPGIGELDAEVLFQRYRRGTSVKQGSGLGLFVARQIAQACGGDLQYVQPRTKGSCFEFSLRYIDANELSAQNNGVN